MTSYGDIRGGMVAVGDLLFLMGVAQTVTPRYTPGILLSQNHVRYEPTTCQITWRRSSRHLELEKVEIEL